MVKPVDDRSPPSPLAEPAVPGPSTTNLPYPYGNYRERSADGKWYFEWTPFTPAIVAWHNAKWHLDRARDRLVDARKIDGFVIQQLEDDYRDYMDEVKKLADEVDKATREAGKVVSVLNAANTDYAMAHDASWQEYQAVKNTIDSALAAQCRRVR